MKNYRNALNAVMTNLKNWTNFYKACPALDRLYLISNKIQPASDETEENMKRILYALAFVTGVALVVGVQRYIDDKRYD